jgi:hypothetical protein
MKQMQLTLRPWVFLLASAIVALAGCSGPSRPSPADSVQAREALRLALDSWQKGVAADCLKERQPPIQVVDHQWRTGYQLVRYQLGSDGQLGANLRCQVQLALKNPKGKALNKKAVYSVGTSPVLTVCREEDP